MEPPLSEASEKEETSAPAALGFGAYYRKVCSHFWAGFKKHLVANVLATVGGAVGVVMLVITNINPPVQTAARIVSVIAWPLSLLLILLVGHVVLAPWKFHGAVHDEHNEGLQKLERERKAELKLLQDAQKETLQTIESGHREIVDEMRTAHNDTKAAKAVLKRQLEEKETALASERERNQKPDITLTIGSPGLYAKSGDSESRSGPGAPLVRTRAVCVTLVLQFFNSRAALATVDSVGLEIETENGTIETHSLGEVREPMFVELQRPNGVHPLERNLEVPQGPTVPRYEYFVFTERFLLHEEGTSFGGVTRYREEPIGPTFAGHCTFKVSARDSYGNTIIGQRERGPWLSSYGS